MTTNDRIVTAPFRLAGRPAILLAGAAYSPQDAKTAVAYRRARPADVVAVVVEGGDGSDAPFAPPGATPAPMVPSVERALEHAPGAELAVVGTAPMGGGLDERLRRDVAACLDAGLDVASGLHVFLSDDDDLAARARRSGARIWDARRPPRRLAVADGAGCRSGARVVLVAGTDCNVGKMTAAATLCDAARARGVRASWAATGQTGMFIRERGVAVDRVPADFIGGAAQALVDVEGRDRDVVFVEGQGSIFHPGYAGVTLGLMFGAMPDAIVMAHAPGRETIRHLDLPSVPLARHVEVTEALVRAFRPRTRVVALAVNTVGLGEAAAREAVESVRGASGLPAADVVRFDPAPVLDAVLDFLEVAR